MGKGTEQYWTPVPVGTWHCMALPTFGAFCIIKDFAALLLAVLLDVLPRTEFLRPFPQLGLGQSPAMDGANTDSFLPRVSGSFASTGLCGTRGQSSSSVLSLPSRNNTLPDVSWHSKAQLGLQLPSCPRASSSREVLAQWSLYHSTCTGSRHREPQACTGRWVEGIEIRQQTQHGGVGRGDPFPSPLKWGGPVG